MFSSHFLKESGTMEDVTLFRLSIVDDSDPFPGAPAGWIKPGDKWFNTSDHCWYRRTSSGWDLVVDASDHPHHELGDVNFIGSIKADGEEGISGSRLIPGVGTLTFTKGILTGFTPA